MIVDLEGEIGNLNLNLYVIKWKRVSDQQVFTSHFKSTNLRTALGKLYVGKEDAGYEILCAELDVSKNLATNNSE